MADADHHPAIELLAGIAPFNALSPETLADVAESAIERRLRRGEILIREGELGGSMFVVVSGRLRAYVHDGNESPVVVGEISAGESVGEMALLSEQPRTASVRAIRDTNLIELSRAAFHEIVEHEPVAVSILARTIVERLGRSIHGSDGTGNLRTIALIAAGGTGDIRPVATELADELATGGAVKVVDGDGFLEVSDGDSSRWVQDLESRYDKILLLAEPASSDWTRRCIGQADRVLLIGRPDASPDLNQVEQDLLTDIDHDAHTRIDLVMVHDSDRAMPAPVGRWLAARPGIHCVNLQPGGRHGYARLRRLLSGEAINLVLSGGGARGLAHIGVLKALEEARIPIDFVGGASFGSITAGFIAMGYGWEEARDATVRNLLGSGSPVDLTAPLVALARGAKVRRQLRGGFGDVAIEDLWLRFFCVSSNLTHGEVQVHREGPLWEAIRASISIPGVFPPIRSRIGDVLVDGAVMNNLPVDVAQAIGEPGPILAVNLRSPIDMTSRDLPHDGAVSGWNALFSRFTPWRRKSAVPGIAETLLRTSEIGSVISSKTFEARADLVFRPPVADFALMDFSAIDDLIDVGYRHAVEILEHNSPIAVESPPLLADRDLGRQR